MTTAPFPVDPALVAITVACRDQSYIADGVLPRVPAGVQHRAPGRVFIGNSLKDFAG